jgi:hypothetical protein
VGEKSNPKVRQVNDSRKYFLARQVIRSRRTSLSRARPHQWNLRQTKAAKAQDSTSSTVISITEHRKIHQQRQQCQEPRQPVVPSANPTASMEQLPCNPSSSTHSEYCRLALFARSGGKARARVPCTVEQMLPTMRSPRCGRLS